VSKHSSDSYRWVDDPVVTDFANAGCVTVVTGSSGDTALAAVGADSAHASPLADVSGVEGIGWISVANEVAGLPDDAIVLVEDAGWEGSRPEVLARLSRKGAAASVFWDVNGLVMFGCARRGKVQVSLEVPDSEEEAAELPAALRRVWQRERTVAGPVAVAMSMVQRFTGVAVPPDEAIARPRLAHPIIEPVLSLRVTPEELLELRYPSPTVVAAAKAAEGTRCRTVAEWAVRDALTAAGIADLPQLASTLQQFGSGDAVALSAEASSYRREAAKGISAADWALSVEGDDERWQELRHWGPRYWAMEAVAYLAVTDDVIAVLGSTYCAGIHRGLGSDEHELYLVDVVERLGAGA
jgi:hypothetical protein